MNCLLTISLGFDLTLLDKLNASIDYPIEAKAVVNNGRKGALNEWGKSHPEWKIINDTGNHIGFAGAVNMAPKLWPNESSYFIVNDDIVFHPGCLKQVYDIPDSVKERYPIICVHKGSICAFVWTKMGISKLGLYDENFWPAYYEDSEMKLRIHLAGMKMAHLYENNAPFTHYKPPCGRNFGDTTKGTEIFSREYYLRKWGVTAHDQPSFKHPFNDPTKPLNTWTLDVKHRKKIEPLWETFMSLPGASIYT